MSKKIPANHVVIYTTVIMEETTVIKSFMIYKLDQIKMVMLSTIMGVLFYCCCAILIIIEETNSPALS